MTLETDLQDAIQARMENLIPSALGYAVVECVWVKGGVGVGSPKSYVIKFYNRDGYPKINANGISLKLRISHAVAGTSLYTMVFSGKVSAILNSEYA